MTIIFLYLYILLISERSCLTVLGFLLSKEESHFISLSYNSGGSLMSANVSNPKLGKE